MVMFITETININWNKKKYRNEYSLEQVNIDLIKNIVTEITVISRKIEELKKYSWILERSLIEENINRLEEFQNILIKEYNKLYKIYLDIQKDNNQYSWHVKLSLRRLEMKINDITKIKNKYKQFQQYNYVRSDSIYNYIKKLFFKFLWIT